MTTAGAGAGSDKPPARQAEKMQKAEITKEERTMKWRDNITDMKICWIGKRVRFGGEVYTVVDVDYNGALLIDKKAQFTDTTAVGTNMVEVLNNDR